MKQHIYAKKIPQLLMVNCSHYRSQITVHGAVLPGRAARWLIYIYIYVHIYVYIYIYIYIS